MLLELIGVDLLLGWGGGGKQRNENEYEGQDAHDCGFVYECRSRQGCRIQVNAVLLKSFIGASKIEIAHRKESISKSPSCRPMKFLENDLITCSAFLPLILSISVPVRGIERFMIGRSRIQIG